MELRAISMIELNSIAKGVETADEMLKTADVDLIMAQPICAGKYMVLVSGDVDSVERASEIGKANAAEFLVDDFVIPNVHASVFPALTATTRIQDIDSLADIETFSVAAAIKAADFAIKEAELEILRIHIAMAVGGKGFVAITGNTEALKSAVVPAIEYIKGEGMLAGYSLIENPHAEVLRELI